MCTISFTLARKAEVISPLYFIFIYVSQYPIVAIALFAGAHCTITKVVVSQILSSFISIRGTSGY